MRLRVLGSASSQGIPHPFCHCSLCQKAQGKDKRLRNSYLVELEGGKNILLDASPDWSHQQTALYFDFDFLFLSHKHRDHTQGLEELRVGLGAACKNKGGPQPKKRTFLIGKTLHHWLFDGPRNSRWQESTQQAYQQLLHRGFFRSLILTPFKKMRLFGKISIIYLRGRHLDNYCGGLVIQEGQKTLAYLADISEFSQKLLSFLKKNLPNLLIAHTPFFHRDQEDHLGVEDLTKLPGEKILLSHFSHRVKLSHEKLVKKAERLDPRFTLAFDNQILKI